MNKRCLALLEKAFAAEVSAALGNNRLFVPGMLQTKSKLAETMVEEGYLVKCKENIAGVIVEGYKLTPVGHMAYCVSCEGKEND